MSIIHIPGPQTDPDEALVRDRLLVITGRTLARCSELTEACAGKPFTDLGWQRLMDMQGIHRDLMAAVHALDRLAETERR